MKIIVTVIPANLVTNLILSLFRPFVETKSKNQILTKLALMMIKRSGRGGTYDVTGFLSYKNLLIMQNLEKIIQKQAFWLSTFFFGLSLTFVKPRDIGLFSKKVAPSQKSR